MNMEPNNYNLQKDIDTVVAVLPPVIRAYLAQGKYTVVAKSLMAKYSLRIDQGGVLEREITLLLMGIDTPDEFTQALIEEAKLSQQIVNNIVQDVNAQIFVPLRKEEEEKGIAAPEPVRGTIEGVRPMPPPQAAANQVPSIAPLRPSVASNVDGPHFFHLENKIPSSPHSAPLPPKTAMPHHVGAIGAGGPRVLGTLGDVVRSIVAPKMLEDHEEPHIEFNKTPTTPASPPFVSPNLPGTMPEVPAPIAPPKTEFRMPLPVSAPKPAPLPSNKSYATDPYREPVDDHISEI